MLSNSFMIICRVRDPQAHLDDVGSIVAGGFGTQNSLRWNENTDECWSTQTSDGQESSFV